MRHRGLLARISETLESDEIQNTLNIMQKTCLKDTPLSIYARLMLAELFLKEDDIEKAHDCYVKISSEYYNKYPNDTHHYACLLVYQAMCTIAIQESYALLQKASSLFADNMSKVCCKYSCANIGVIIWREGKRQDQDLFNTILQQYKEALELHKQLVPTNRLQNFATPYLILIDDLFIENNLDQTDLHQEWKKLLNSIYKGAGTTNASSSEQLSEVSEDVKANGILEAGNQFWINLDYENMQKSYLQALHEDNLDPEDISIIERLMNEISKPIYHCVKVILKESAAMPWTKKIQCTKNTSSALQF